MLNYKELIQQEKLIKNPLVSFKVPQLKEIDEEISKLKKDKRIKLRDDCIKELQNPVYQNSVTLNYIIGIIKLLNKPHEQNVILTNLTLDFYNSRNWDVAEFIANKIPNSPKALRVLGDTEGEKGNEEEKWRYYEEYAKTDNQDTDIIVKVADHKELEDNKKEAASYYQRALIRLGRQEDWNMLYEVYNKLLNNGKPDFAYFLSYIDNLKVSDERNSSSDLTNDIRYRLYLSLIKHLIKERENLKSNNVKPLVIRKNLDDIILTCKKALYYFPESEELKKNTIDALKIRYQDNPRYNELAKQYNILTSSKPSQTLDDFLNDIQYVEKAYVVTKSSPIKVGIISQIKDGKVTIRYSGNSGEKVVPLSTIKDTHNAITTQHIKAIKIGVPKDKIVEKINNEDGANWLLRTLLYSLPKNSGTLKDMKLEVVPSILSESEWKRVSEQIKNVAIENPYIRIEQGTTLRFTLSDQPLTKEEKALYTYKSVSELNQKINAFLDALQVKDVDLKNDSYKEIVDDLTNIVLNPTTEINSKIQAALTLDLASGYGVPVDQDDLFITVLTEKDPTLTEIKYLFGNITSSELKRKFIQEIVESSYGNPTEILIELFPLYPNQLIPKELKKLDESVYNQYIERVIANFRNYYTPFVFFALDPKILNEKQLKLSHLTKERLFKTKLMALSALSVASDKESDKNFKSLKKALVEQKEIDNYLKKASEAELLDIKAVLLSNNGLDTAEKNTYKEIIKNRFPDFSFSVEEKKVVTPPKSDEVGFFTTPSSFQRKQAELKELKEKDIPENLKDIQNARELGDLRENAEYQYAKDHKRELERKERDLTLDLMNVKIVKPDQVNDNQVGFGTKVDLYDNLLKKDVTYTFLGRWESNPERNIIDINAPIGRKLFNHKINDRVEFAINDIKFDYTIKKIEKVDFE